MALVQAATAQRTTGTANVDVTLTGVANGNYLAVLVTGDANQAPTITTQSGSTGAWTQPAALNVWNGSDFFKQDGAYAVATATGNVTVRAAAGTSSYLSVVVVELSSIASFDQAGYVRDTTGGTDSVLGQSLTPASVPAMRLAFAIDYSVTPVAPTAGTNYTDSITYFPYGGNDAGRVAYRQVTGSPVAASDTFTDAAGGPWHVASFIFLESAGAAPDDIVSVWTDPDDPVYGTISEYSFLFEDAPPPPSTDTPITACFSLGYY